MGQSIQGSIRPKPLRGSHRDAVPDEASSQNQKPNRATYPGKTEMKHDEEIATRQLIGDTYHWVKPDGFIIGECHRIPDPNSDAGKIAELIANAVEIGKRHGFCNVSHSLINLRKMKGGADEA